MGTDVGGKENKLCKWASRCGLNWIKKIVLVGFRLPQGTYRHEGTRRKVAPKFNEALYLSHWRGCVVPVANNSPLLVLRTPQLLPCAFYIDTP